MKLLLLFPDVQEEIRKKGVAADCAERVFENKCRKGRKEGG